MFINPAAVFINPAAISIGDNSRTDAFDLISAGPAGGQIGRNVHIGAACQVSVAGARDPGGLHFRIRQGFRVLVQR